MTGWQMLKMKTLPLSSQSTMALLQILPSPLLPDQYLHAQVNELDVAWEIKFFPNGSAGGPDRLDPQHIKDMIQPYWNEPSTILPSLASFCLLVLKGRLPEKVCPFLGGYIGCFGKKVWRGVA